MWKRLIIIFGALVMTCLLDRSYVLYISPYFEYQGMFLKELPQYMFTLKLLLALLPSYWLPIEIEKPSQFQVWLLYITVYIPAIVVGYHIIDDQKFFGYSVFVVVMAFCLILLTYVSYLNKIKIKTLSFNKLQFLTFVVIMTILTFSLLAKFYGIPSFLLGIGETYKYRVDFKEKVTTVPIIVNYLYFWQGLVITPLIIILGIIRKNAIYIAVGIALQYSLFCFTTLRTFVMAIFFIIYISIFFLVVKKNRGIMFLYSIILIISACLYLAAISGGASLVSRIFLQRWLLSSGQLSSAYYDYFSDNDKAYWGDSLLSGYVEYSYGDLSPSQVIGDIYVSLGNENIANASANFWSDAFANAGYPGLFTATLFAACLLWIVDSVFSKYNHGVAVIMFSMCALSLTEQGLQTSMLTGGIFLLIMIGMVSSKVFQLGERWLGLKIKLFT